MVEGLSAGGGASFVADAVVGGLPAEAFAGEAESAGRKPLFSALISLVGFSELQPPEASRADASAVPSAALCAEVFKLSCSEWIKLARNVAFTVRSSPRYSQKN